MNPNTERFIPFALPSIGEEEERGVVEVLRSGWLTTGPVAKRFEAEVAALVGSRHALALNSATAGLHLALEAVGVGAGDRVLTTPYTFAASAEVIRYLGASPLFLDIDGETLNIDPSGVEEALSRGPSPREGGSIRAVLPVHVGGLPCRMERILAACAAAGVPLVEDAAHAFPVRTEGLGGRRAYCGTLGAAGVYSFYATKTITTGEGGMLVTDSDEIARRVSLMRLHGIDREVWNRYVSRDAEWRYEIVEAGYKYNLTDIAAAIGRAQLAKAADFLERRRSIAARYLAAFADADYLRLPAASDDHAWHLFTLRIVEDRLTIDRDEMVRSLMDHGIGVSVHFIPLHIMPYYRNAYGFKPEDFPNALQAYRTIFSLPIYPSLTDEQVERVVAGVRSVAERHRRGRPDAGRRG